MKKLFTFKGRLSRLGYLKLLAIYVFIPCILVGLISVFVLSGESFRLIPYVCSLLLIFFALIAMVYITVRRLHDIDWHGLWSLLLFTFVGPIMTIVLFFLPGTKGDNKYGPMLK